jgi:hypothetical protein
MLNHQNIRNGNFMSELQLKEAAKRILDSTLFMLDALTFQMEEQL